MNSHIHPTIASAINYLTDDSREEKMDAKKIERLDVQTEFLYALKTKGFVRTNRGLVRSSEVVHELLDFVVCADVLDSALAHSECPLITALRFALAHKYADKVLNSYNPAAQEFSH